MLEYFSRWLRRHQGIQANPIYRLAVDVATHRIAYERALADAQSYAIVSQLADGDLIELDRQADFETGTNIEFGLLLARLTVAAARAKSFEKVYADLCLSLANMLDRAGYHQERDYYLNEALQSSQRISYTTGYRRVLNTMARVASLESNDSAARHYLMDQLQAGREDADTRDDVDTALMLARASMVDGDPDSADELYQRAARSSKRLGYNLGVVEALLNQSSILIARGDHEPALMLLRQAEEAAAHVSDQSLVGKLTLQYAQTLSQAGRPQDARDRALVTLDIARQLEDLELETGSLRVLAAAERSVGPRDQALLHLEQLVSLEQRLDHAYEAGNALMQLAELYIGDGDLDRAVQVLSEARSSAHRSGDSRLNIRVHGLLGMVLMDQGSERGALDALDTAVSESRRIGDDASETTWLLAAGEALLRFEGADEARQVIDRSEYLARTLDDPILHAQVMALQGQIALVSGDSIGASDAFSRAVELARQGGDSGSVLYYLPVLARLAVMSGDVSHGFRLFNQAIELAEQIGDRAGAGSLHGQTARLYQRIDDQESAIEHYEEALAAAEAIGDQRMKNRALQGIAAAYDASGDLESAADSYRQALSTAEAAGDVKSITRLNFNLGALLVDLNQPDQARIHLTRARDAAQNTGDLSLYDRANNILSAISFQGGMAGVPEDLQLDEGPAPPRHTDGY